MSDDQFTKLFRYIQDFRHEVDERFEKVDQRFDRIETIMDGFAGDLTTNTQEVTAMQSKLHRHDKYIEALATKTDVNLGSIQT